MTTPAQTVRPPGTGMKNNVRNFWNRVSEGMELNQLWSQMVKDARSSYRLYSAGLDQLPEQSSRRRQAWQKAKALFWAVLEKLTPARRVLLLLGLILLLFTSGEVPYTDGSRHLRLFVFDEHVWGGLLLLAVLLLELADRVVMKRDLEIAK